MRIGIVHVESGWILQKIACRLCESIGGATLIPVSHYGPVDLDALFYVDVQNCFPVSAREVNPGALHVGMFTHAHEDNQKSIRKHWLSLDGIVQMCNKYMEMFESLGYPPERTTVLRPGEVSHFPLKKTKIGICQRGEHIGKGRDFLPEVIRLLAPEIKAGMELHFKGKGWDDAFEHKAFRGATFFGGEQPEEWFSGSYYGVSAFSYASEDAKSYAPFYEKLDYYLVCGLYEGGPMGALEAFSTGLPIISSDVGWMDEFGVEHLYHPGDIEELANILTSIVSRRIDRRNKVSGMSYKNYADGVLGFFEHLRTLG